MSKMEKMGDKIVATMSEYAGQNEERGYCLVIWDGDGEQYRTVRGQVGRVLRKLSQMMAHAIVYSMKEEKLEVGALREALNKISAETALLALDLLEVRMGKERFRKDTEAYLLKRAMTDGEAEERLAEMIGKDAKSDDGAGKV